MRFIIFVIDGPRNPAGPDEMKHIDAFNEKLQANGHWITAAGIKEPGNATLINGLKKGDEYFNSVCGEGLCSRRRSKKI